MREINASLKQSWGRGKSLIVLVVISVLVAMGGLYGIFKRGDTGPIQQADTGAANEALGDKIALAGTANQPKASPEENPKNHPEDIIVKSTRKTPNTRAAYPVSRKAPIIPNEAAHSGHCVIQFDVTSTGRTDNIEVRSCTDVLFAAPAKDAVSRWVYAPKTIDEIAVLQTGTTTTVSFKLTDEDGDLLAEPQPVDAEINALLGEEDRAQIVTKNSEDIERLSAIPTSEYCCMRFSVSQIGTVFNEDAVSCTDIRAVNRANEFVRFLEFAPASFNNANISSADYTMLVKFYSFTEVRKNARKENVLTIGSQAEKDQVCKFD